MTLNFPTNPSLDATYTYQGTTYRWDGEKWDASNPTLVNTVNIVDDAVTTSKIADDAVTVDKIDTPAPVVGYQQGTWITTVATGTTTDTGNNTWVRVGNKVTVIGFLNTWTDRTSSATFVVKGLPYPMTTNDVAGVAMLTNTARAATTVFSSLSTGGMIFYQTAVNGSWGALTHADTGGGSQVRFQATYITDDTTWTPSNGATVS